MSSVDLHLNVCCQWLFYSLFDSVLMCRFHLEWNGHLTIYITSIDMYMQKKRKKRKEKKLFPSTVFFSSPNSGFGQLEGSWPLLFSEWEWLSVFFCVATCPKCHPAFTVAADWSSSRKKMVFSQFKEQGFRLKEVSKSSWSNSTGYTFVKCLYKKG